MSKCMSKHMSICTSMHVRPCVRVEAVHGDARPAYADNACQAHMLEHMSKHMSKHMSRHMSFLDVFFL